MDTENEEWKDIPGFEELYEVSAFGGVKSKTRIVTKIYANSRILKQTYKSKTLNGHKNKEGYTYFVLSKDGKTHPFCIATLILLAFVGPRPSGQEACHWDGNNQNNILSNLRWDTHLNNIRDRLKHKTYLIAEDHPMAILTTEKAREIFLSTKSGIDLAAENGVSAATISAIRKKRIWKSLHGEINGA